MSRDLFPILTDEQAAELKKEYPQQELRVTELTTPKEVGLGTVSLVWRPPAFDEYERWQEAFVKEGMLPAVELMASVMVWPEPPSGKSYLSMYELMPDAINNWINERIRPFFGLGTTETTRLL